MTQHSPAIRSAALSMVRQGLPQVEVADRLAVPRGTIGWWCSEERRALGIPAVTHDCPRCLPRSLDDRSYTHLLGLYLGDGHILSRGKAHRISISCDDSWPGLIAAARTSMRAVMPKSTVALRQRTGCTDVTSYSKHWVCLFPQHGAGKKHDRPIVLEGWQRELVARHPWELVRGLIHSDGCRVTNWTTRVVRGERRRYEYPRYFFTNTSVDIIGLYTGTLDALGVEWRHLGQSRRAQTISVARRGSVALLDEFVGPKF